MPSNGATEHGGLNPSLHPSHVGRRGCCEPTPQSLGKGTLSALLTPGYWLLVLPSMLMPIFSHLIQLYALAQSWGMEGEPHGHAVLSLSLFARSRGTHL